MKEKAPDFIENDEELEEYLKYLDGLRESGARNMYGAAPIHSSYF